MQFPNMCDFLQEKEGERFLLRYSYITESDISFMRLRDAINRRSEYLGQEEGTFVQLVDKQGDEIVMSDMMMERRSNYEIVRRANGKVLLAGLGLGLIILPIQGKPGVEAITVIEKYPEVTALVAPQLPFNDKVTIVDADIFEWYPQKGVKYDIIYFDIWNDWGGGNYEEMKRLHRRFGKRLNRENLDSWMGSWRRYDCKRASQERLY